MIEKLGGYFNIKSIWAPRPNQGHKMMSAVVKPESSDQLRKEAINPYFWVVIAKLLPIKNVTLSDLNLNE